MIVYRDVDGKLSVFITALDGGEWSPSRSTRFSPGEMPSMAI
jgi:hypothetical protein